MSKNQRKYFLFFVIILTVIILFFSSAFILPVAYIYTKSTVKVIMLLSLSSIASALTIAVIATYLSPTVNEGIMIMKRYGRLENFNHPLLLRLSTEAPGSFHHSINVAILAQKAAKKIGADSNLVRIASYYHDIGKLIHPEIYIENQRQYKEKFKNLTQIKKIAKIITKHAKIGAKIAADYHLPDEIVDIIAEHHGSTIAKFLYDSAENFADVDKNDFKYPGPKPQTAESVIVMLADCVEAATKGSHELDDQKIAEIVDKTIEDKIAEKQFYNLRLSAQIFQKIRNSFIDTLSSMYHQRIYIDDNNENRDK